MEKISVRQYFNYESYAYTYLPFDSNNEKSVIIDSVLEQFDMDMGMIKNWR